MTLHDIYKSMEDLGMLSDEDCDSIDEKQFSETICKDIVKILNFVDDLFLWNDNDTLKKFIVSLLVKCEKE